MVEESSVVAENKRDYYIPSLSLNKTSTVIGWFLHWSHAPYQIQMYPDRDTIPQLLPAPDVLLRLLTETSKYTTH